MERVCRTQDERRVSVRGQDSSPWLRIMLDEVLELVDVGVLGGFAGRHCADLAVMVQWPAA